MQYKDEFFILSDHCLVNSNLALVVLLESNIYLRNVYNKS